MVRNVIRNMGEGKRREREGSLEQKAGLVTPFFLSVFLIRRNASACLPRVREAESSQEQSRAVKSLPRLLLVRLGEGWVDRDFYVQNKREECE